MLKFLEYDRKTWKYDWEGGEYDWELRSMFGDGGFWFKDEWNLGKCGKMGVRSVGV